MIRLLHSATEWLHHPPPPRLGHLSGISRIRVLIKGLPEAEILVIIERLSITSTSNGKREFVPRDQVSPFLVAYCSLFLHIN